MLYVVATPIGNLEDISLRALRVLKEADLIAAEDTRRTLKLLSHYKIRNRIDSYNDINKIEKTRLIINHLKKGKDVAICSDSGTPGISDPGFYLIRECIKEGIKIVPVPGPCSAITALVCSGLPTDRFTFLGFNPKKVTRKFELYDEIKKIEGTVIIFETPHRIVRTLEDLAKVFPEKKIVLCRELTKKFEEFIRGTTKEVYEKVKDMQLKGEIVLVLY